MVSSLSTIAAFAALWIQDADWVDTRTEPLTGGLDGLAVHGDIRAEGMAGLVSVRGRLSFRAGQLVWTVDGQSDTGPYQTEMTETGLAFSAEHVLENDERVFWTGRYDGARFRDVTAEWVRVEGDFIHDLLLPERVTLSFTPDD